MVSNLVHMHITHGDANYKTSEKKKNVARRKSVRTENDIHVNNGLTVDLL